MEVMCATQARDGSLGTDPSSAEVTLRAPTLADVAAAVAVINRESQRLRGRDDVDETAISGWWTQPAPFDLERDVVLASEDGEVVGYGDLGDQANDGTVLWLDVRGDALAEVHAELERRALERRAADGVVRAVSDARTTRTAGCSQSAATSGSGRRTGCGSTSQARLFEPPWPAGARVRAAVEGVDEPLLHDVLETRVRGSLGLHADAVRGVAALAARDAARRSRRSGSSPRSTARSPASRSAGRASTATRPRAGSASSASCRSYRRRGLATALLMHAFAAFQARGLTRARLGVDAESTTGAVRLYERAGMTVDERHDIWERRE